MGEKEVNPVKADIQALSEILYTVELEQYESIGVFCTLEQEYSHSCPYHLN